MINILSRWRRVGGWMVEKDEDGRKGRGVEKWKVNWNEERSQGRVAERREGERERERGKCAVGRVGKKKGRTKEGSRGKRERLWAWWSVAVQQIPVNRIQLRCYREYR